jgi:hypothetical protein
MGLETVMTSVVELVPYLGPRTQQLKTVLLSLGFCVLYFLGSVACLPLKELSSSYFISQLNDNLYLFFLLLFVLSVVPICVSKVCSPAKEDLLSFVQRQVWIRPGYSRLLALLSIILIYIYLGPLICFYWSNVRTENVRKYFKVFKIESVPYIICLCLVVLITLLTTVVSGVFASLRKVGFCCPLPGWNHGNAPLAVAEDRLELEEVTS